MFAEPRDVPLAGLRLPSGGEEDVSVLTGTLFGGERALVGNLLTWVDRGELFSANAGGHADDLCQRQDWLKRVLGAGPFVAKAFRLCPDRKSVLQVEVEGDRFIDANLLTTAKAWE